MALRFYKDCIEACQACLVACEQCASACLRKSDVAGMIRCIELNRSCAEMCGFAIREMARSSPVVEQICEWCAELSEACADEGSRHELDYCRASAAACRTCAQACRELAEAPRIVDQ